MIPNVGQNGKLGQISICFMYIHSYFIPIFYIYIYIYEEHGSEYFYQCLYFVETL